MQNQENIKIIKLIGYAFCLLVVFQSIQQFYIGFERPPSSNLFLYIYEENINLPNEDDLLVSLNERHPYILLNTRTYDTTVDKNTGEIIFTKELQWPLIESKGFIYLLGDRTYIDRAFIKISKMAKSNKYKVIINKLTPELNRFKGWALVEIELIEFS